MPSRPASRPANCRPQRRNIRYSAQQARPSARFFVAEILHSGLAKQWAAEFLKTNLMSVRLSSLLDPTRILLDVQSTKRTAALHEIAALLEPHPDVANFPSFYQELLARERLDTTCLGNEIAIPHARTEHVKQIVIAVGRSTAGVHFENSNQNVRLLFILGTPKSNPGDYLMLVGSLCRLVKDAPHREALFAATTPAAFIATVQELENKILGPLNESA